MSERYVWSEGIDLFVKGRISEVAARRQQETAKEILKRMKAQPGLILADEVGMGKTFVALAVGVSAYLHDPEKRPVVVMMPSNIQEKWMHDFETFREACLSEDLRRSVKAKKAERSEEFLKALDDPEDHRPALIFMTHGAMSRQLTDSWVKWAILRQSVKGRHNAADIKGALVRFGADIIELRSKSNTLDDPISLWEDLLAKEPEEWVKVLKRHKALQIAFKDNEEIDDLVPGPLLEIIKTLNTDQLYQELLDVLPRRESANLKDRLKDTRKAIRGHLVSVWTQAVKNMKVTSPLLIMDEAHHLKNASTQIARLFQTPESMEDASELEKGALANVFDRMLFLTATPFQLGHHELVGVLQRFQGIRWDSRTGITYSRETYMAELSELSLNLDDAQMAALRLDKEWGKLPADERGGRQETDAEVWWSSLLAMDTDSQTVEAEVAKAYHITDQKMRAGESLLRRWVVRHNRPKKLDPPHREVLRRLRFEGAGILKDENSSQGLEIRDEAILPFLLAARAAAGSPTTRPVFAEGLASSYEAFLDTRAARVKGEACRPIDSEGDPEVSSDEQVEFGYYLEKIEKALPRKSGFIEGSHPKIAATVNKAVDLWEKGEKVLIFCHYIKTGQVLRQQITRQLLQKIEGQAEKRLSCSKDKVEAKLESIGNAFQKTQRSGIIDGIILGLLQNFNSLSVAHKDELSDITKRMLRTPSFLVRYFPLEKYQGEVTRELIKEAFSVKRDSSGMTYQEVLKEFFDFLQGRCKEKERDGYIQALKKIQTGSHYGKEAASSFEDDERMNEKEILLPNVRLANGQVKIETRQRLMLTFNTPFYPEILIASSVMAEGVDLHLSCRYVIHHDLSWNPSSLEQRTGRVDRIGAKVEKCGQPIHIYYPFVAETQDEKMFRVVMDRERWFKVIMGEKYDCHTTEATERMLRRRLFPESAAEKLAFKLGVVET